MEPTGWCLTVMAILLQVGAFLWLFRHDWRTRSWTKSQISEQRLGLILDAQESWSSLVGGSQVGQSRRSDKLRRLLEALGFAVWQVEPASDRVEEEKRPPPERGPNVPDCVGPIETGVILDPLKRLVRVHAFAQGPKPQNGQAGQLERLGHAIELIKAQAELEDIRLLGCISIFRKCHQSGRAQPSGLNREPNGEAPTRAGLGHWWAQTFWALALLAASWQRLAHSSAERASKPRFRFLLVQDNTNQAAEVQSSGLHLFERLSSLLVAVLAGSLDDGRGAAGVQLLEVVGPMERGEVRQTGNICSKIRQMFLQICRLLCRHWLEDDGQVEIVFEEQSRTDSTGAAAAGQLSGPRVKPKCGPKKRAPTSGERVAEKLEEQEVDLIHRTICELIVLENPSERVRLVIV